MGLVSLHSLDRTEGTVRMRETDSEGVSQLVLVPHPNMLDPNDPLRWPAWRKNVAFAAVCSFAWNTNFAIGGLAPAFYPLSIQFNKTQAETSQLLIYPILVLGLFNFFWVPVANIFGKRPVFVFASGLLCVAYAWGAAAQSFKSLFWSNIIAAFAGSSTEALGAALVNDIYFLHERANKMSIYMSAISTGNSLGPLICGFVAQSLGWRWHKGIATILTGINFLCVVLFVPETRYDRDYSSALDTQSSTAELASGDYYNNSGEKGLHSSPAATEVALTPRMGSPTGNNGRQVPKKTFLQNLSLYSGVPKTSIPKMFIRPFPLFFYPAVTFAFLAYALSLFLVVSVNLLNSFVLEAPPYNWTIAQDGLINIPGIIGNVVGSFASGWCVDRYCDWRTRKNGGIFVPESRLTMLIPALLIVPAGAILFGYGVGENLGWPSLFVGYGMISFGLCAVPTITMTYVSDILLPVAPDALLLINGLKNIVAFGFLYGIVEWFLSGPKDCFGAQAGIFAAVIVLGGLPLAIWGAKIRHATSQWKIVIE